MSPITNRRLFYTALGLAASLVPAWSASLPPGPSAPPPDSPREFYNAGTRELRQGKLREAEASLQTALSSQDERLQPSALYNLGHVRFGLGLDELKKGPSASQSSRRGQAAAQTAGDAVHDADQALASNDVQQMVASYLRG